MAEIPRPARSRVATPEELPIRVSPAQFYGSLMHFGERMSQFGAQIEKEQLFLEEKDTAFRRRDFIMEKINEFYENSDKIWKDTAAEKAPGSGQFATALKKKYDGVLKDFQSQALKRDLADQDTLLDLQAKIQPLMISQFGQAQDLDRKLLKNNYDVGFDRFVNNLSQDVYLNRGNLSRNLTQIQNEAMSWKLQPQAEGLFLDQELNDMIAKGRKVLLASVIQSSIDDPKNKYAGSNGQIVDTGAVDELEKILETTDPSKLKPDEQEFLKAVREDFNADEISNYLTAARNAKLSLLDNNRGDNTAFLRQAEKAVTEATKFFTTGKNLTQEYQNQITAMVNDPRLAGTDIKKMWEVAQNRRDYFSEFNRMPLKNQQDVYLSLAGELSKTSDPEKEAFLDLVEKAYKSNLAEGEKNTYEYAIERGQAKFNPLVLTMADARAKYPDASEPVLRDAVRRSILGRSREQIKATNFSGRESEFFTDQEAKSIIIPYFTNDQVAVADKLGLMMILSENMTGDQQRMLANQFSKDMPSIGHAVAFIGDRPDLSEKFLIGDKIRKINPEMTGSGKAFEQMFETWQDHIGGAFVGLHPQIEQNFKQSLISLMAYYGKQAGRINMKDIDPGTILPSGKSLVDILEEVTGPIYTLPSGKKTLAPRPTVDQETFIRIFRKGAGAFLPPEHTADEILSRTEIRAVGYGKYQVWSDIQALKDPKQLGKELILDFGKMAIAASKVKKEIGPFPGEEMRRLWENK